MRRLLAVLLLAASPAWAVNDGLPSDEWMKARDLCTKAGGDQIICTMRHTPDEAKAMSIASDLVMWCNAPNPPAECPAWRGYIKQRWGY